MHCIMWASGLNLYFILSNVFVLHKAVSPCLYMIYNILYIPYMEYFLKFEVMVFIFMYNLHLIFLGKDENILAQT